MGGEKRPREIRKTNGESSENRLTDKVSVSGKFRFFTICILSLRDNCLTASWPLKINFTRPGPTSFSANPGMNLGREYNRLVVVMPPRFYGLESRGFQTNRATTWTKSFQKDKRWEKYLG